MVIEVTGVFSPGQVLEVWEALCNIHSSIGIRQLPPPALTQTRTQALGKFTFCQMTKKSAVITKYYLDMAFTMEPKRVKPFASCLPVSGSPESSFSCNARSPNTEKLERNISPDLEEVLKRRPSLYRLFCSPVTTREWRAGSPRWQAEHQSFSFY